jgi:predicted O-methyltransferase YrrM
MPYNTDVLGWMTEIELKIIESLAKEVPPNGLIVEVGSMFGRSAICWASTASSSDVYCIDFFYENFKSTHSIPDDHCIENRFPLSDKEYNIKHEFISNTKHLPNIHMIQGESPKDFPEINKEIDLFFLDAAHSNPSDWDNLCYFVPLIRSGGMICGHDYSIDYPDVMRNVNEISKQLKLPVVRFSDSSIWCIRIINKIEKLL